MKEYFCEGGGLRCTERKHIHEFWGVIREDLERGGDAADVGPQSEE